MNGLMNGRKDRWMDRRTNRLTEGPMGRGLIEFMYCIALYCIPVPALWNGLPKDLRQFAHPPNRAPNFTYPPLALSSATFHSRLKTELFKISYPGSTPAPRHV